MKRVMMILAVAALMTAGTVPAEAAEWHAWGTHGGTIDGSVQGVVDAVVNDTDGDTPDYHWNKSSWATRTGQKAFMSTSAFNGMTLDAALQGLSYTVDMGVSTAWANAYWNVMVEDAGGKKAILSPAYNSATSSGFATDGSAGADNDYCIFEAEAGWTGTALTGWYAGEWDDVKHLTITDGPFTEYPDTLGGTATIQDDPVYTVANWAAWADQSANGDGDWEQDGLLFVFGQSTGTSPGRIRIFDVTVNGDPVGPAAPPLPEPAGLGLIDLALLAVRKKRN